MTSQLPSSVAHTVGQIIFPVREQHLKHLQLTSLALNAQRLEATTEVTLGEPTQATAPGAHLATSIRTYYFENKVETSLLAAATARPRLRST